MKKLFFLGFSVIGILLLFAFGTGFISWLEFANHLNTSRELYWIILILGTIIMISSLGWLMRKPYK